MDKEILKEWVSYDPSTGVFTWAKTRTNRVKIGDVAGCIHSKGYLIIRILGTQYYAHRLAWLYVHGIFPPQVDHKNTVKSDNRIDNLRVATSTQNNCNVGATSRNKSGYKGVSWYPRFKKWRACIKKDGKQRHLGYFSSAEEAALAYESSGIDLHGEFFRLRK